MKVLFAASEARPFVASGGLADVIGALPKALNGAGSECRVILPLYSEIPYKFREGMEKIAEFIAKITFDFENSEEEVKLGVAELCKNFPLYE